MRLCLEYSVVEDTLVEATAIGPVLAVCVGDRPKNVRAGTRIMPPPTPIIEPKVPAPRPTAIRTIIVVIGSSNDTAFLYEFSVITKGGKNHLPQLFYPCSELYESTYHSFIKPTQDVKRQYRLAHNRCRFWNCWAELCEATPF